jgi:hypothetical protein
VIKVFGARITEAEAKAIVEYLAEAYGPERRASGIAVTAGAEATHPVVRRDRFHHCRLSERGDAAAASERMADGGNDPAAVGGLTA